MLKMLFEVSAKEGSSLLNNIFSTILHLAPLQKAVRSVFGKNLPEDRPSVLFTEKIFNSYSESPFVLFQSFLSLPLAIATVDLQGGFRGEVWELIIHAGVVVKIVLCLLLFFSIVSWAIIFFKLRVIRLARKENTVFLRMFWDGREMSKVYSETKRLRHSPIAEIFRCGYKELEKCSQLASGSNTSRLSPISPVHRGLQQAFLSETIRLEKAMTFLATTGNTTPFIGLFGTVWGIMDAFRQIGYKGSTSLATVAPGISESLIATAAGLAAAIPAVIAYNYYLNQIGIITSEMESFMNEFLSMAEKRWI
jgi:biopolymer transport protein TolQ